MDKFAYLKALHRQPALKGRAPAHLVLRVILDHADGRTLADAWPSMRTIADEAGLSLGTVRTAVPYLVSAGFLVIEKPGTNHTPAHYRLLLPRVSPDDTQTPDECVSLDATQGQGCVSPHDTQRVISCHAGVSPDDTEQVLEQVHSKPTAREEDADGAPRRAPTTDAMPRCVNTPAPDWAPDNWHQLTKWKQVRLTEQHHRETAA